MPSFEPSFEHCGHTYVADCTCCGGNKQRTHLKQRIAGVSYIVISHSEAISQICIGIGLQGMDRHLR